MVIVGFVVAGSALVISTPFNTNDIASTSNVIIVRDTALEEKIFDRIVHDHALDSNRAITYFNIIENEPLDLKDRLVLASLRQHDLSPAKKILFAKMLDADEAMLKKRLIFNAVHEFDHHNFHDFDHDLHEHSGLKFKDILDDMRRTEGKDKDDCINVWVTSQLLKRVCN